MPIAHVLHKPKESNIIVKRNNVSHYLRVNSLPHRFNLSSSQIHNYWCFIINYYHFFLIFERP